MMREDLPDPDKPVTTTKRFFGMVTLTFLRLLLRAPTISICLIEGRGMEAVDGRLLSFPGILECFGSVFVDVLTGYSLDKLPGSTIRGVVVKFMLKNSALLN